MSAERNGNWVRVRMIASLVGIVALTSASWAGHNHLEQAADRLEDKTDDLEDLIDDDFERSPDYRAMVSLACQLEKTADNLEDAIDDCDWHCAGPLIATVFDQVCTLEAMIGAQNPCYVRPNVVPRALCLTQEIRASLECLQCGLTSECGFTSMPQVRPGYGGTRIHPFPTPVVRGPSGRDHWDRFRGRPEDAQRLVRRPSLVVGVNPRQKR